jgi:asparagine synthase (glutamine-hydrolysing)
MLIGYFGNNPVNPRRLDTILASLSPSSVRLQKAVVGQAGLAAPWILRLPGGESLTGLTGRLLPVGQSNAKLAEELVTKLAKFGTSALEEVDGHWALAFFRPAASSLLLAHDQFGAYQLYYAQEGDSLWYSTSLKALLALPELARQRSLDLDALHAYLAFSYVPAPRTLLKNIRCLPPQTAQVFNESLSRIPPSTKLFRFAPASEGSEAKNETDWCKAMSSRLWTALQHRIEPETKMVAIALSGGLDSSAVTAGLSRLGVPLLALHLDFGPPYNQEKEYAEKVARFLEIPLELVNVQPSRRAVGDMLRRIVWQMEQPYGDPVTLPLWLGNRAISEAGIKILFNGEGGDQLLAGWPNKAMFTAELYGSSQSYDRVETYLRTFHHFYGSDQLYLPELRRVAAQTALQAEIRPYLEEPALPGLFERLRWTNYWTKGSQNILPRAAAMARAYNLEMQAPLFDLEMARFALTLPSELLLKGGVEKYLFKQVLTGMLPPEIIERSKRGMGVPTTEWCLGPFQSALKKWLGSALLKRGLFQPAYIRQLLQGSELPGEIRARRVGEKLWQLAVLEIWLELFLDRVTLLEP